MSAPRKDEVISYLRSHAADLKAAGMSSLYLFGSVARGDAGPDSDVDLFFEYEPHVRGLDVVGLYLALEDLFDCKVDAAVRRSLHPALRESIEADAIQVF
jgi:predicted nucleotidyltransferase